MRVLICLLLLLFVACSDKSVDSPSGGSEDTPRLILGYNDAGVESDIPIIQTDPPPPPPEPELTREERLSLIHI